MAVKGEYNAGKTFLINSLFEKKQTGDVGHMKHTEGVHIYQGTIGEILVNMMDTMGQNSGKMQSGSTGVTDMEVRQQQHAIRGATAPDMVDLTLYVTNAFDNNILAELLAGGYDFKRTVIVHNMKNFTTPATRDAYMDRMKAFFNDTEKKIAGGYADRWEDAEGFMVYRDHDGLTHVFVDNANINGSKFKKAIQYLRHAIVASPPSQRGDIMRDSLQAMMLKAFGIPRGAQVTWKSRKPVVENQGKDITLSLIPRIPRQNRFEVGAKDSSSIAAFVKQAPEEASEQYKLFKFNLQVPFFGLNPNQGRSVTIKKFNFRTITPRSIEAIMTYNIQGPQGVSFVNLPRGVSIAPVARTPGMYEVSCGFGLSNYDGWSFLFGQLFLDGGVFHQADWWGEFRPVPGQVTPIAGTIPFKLDGTRDYKSDSYKDGRFLELTPFTGG